MSVALLVLVLAISCWTDLSSRTIPNRVIAAGCGAALVLSSLSPFIGSLQAVPFPECLIGGSVCFALMFAAWLAGGTGGGDAKLAAVIGMFLGWRDGVSVLFWCHISASIFALGVATVRSLETPRALAGITGDSCDSASAPTLGSEPFTVPMAPFFAIGVAITLIYGSLL